VRDRVLGAWLGWVGCQQEEEPPAPTGTDNDTDTDVDADSDTDSDADTDTTDTATLPLLHQFGDDQVLVIPDGEGLQLMGNDGTLVWSRAWGDLVGPCPLCGGEGAEPDGDGLLLAFTLTGPLGAGGIARIDATGALDFRLDGFGFPHDALRDRTDGTILISETQYNRLIWVDSEGSSLAPVHLLDEDDPTWPGLTPNGNFLFDHEGRHYVLVSHRGAGTNEPAGAITMWDISDPDLPELRWRFPAVGALKVPHSPIFREWQGQWWMLWAHTEGSETTGTVGLAVGASPLDLPQYVADLVPKEPLGPFAFLRGVELTDDGWLYLTDTGPFGVPGIKAGRVLQTPLPALVPDGVSTGAIGNQVFVEIVTGAVVLDGLDQPFEGWLWTPTFPID
jgi:hypothetical protein